MNEARRFDRMSTAGLAVLLAFLFWYVRNDTERAMSDINLLPGGGAAAIACEGVPDEWDAYIGASEPVVLTVRGLGDRLVDMSADDVTLYTDCASVDPATGPVMRPVEWRWSPSSTWASRRRIGARIVRIDPPQVLVRFDRVVTETLRVSVGVAGQAGQGMVLERERVSPDAVMLQGPARSLARVERVAALVPDVEGAVGVTRRYTDVAVSALDAAGTPVPALTPFPAFVDVSARFSPTGLRLPVLVPPPTGRVPDGYWLRGREIEPREVTVYGPRERMASLVAEGVVNAQIFDITGMTTTRQVRVPLDLPEGLRVDGLPTGEITVTVLVEALPGRSEFALDVVVERLPPGLTATISPQRVLVAVTGSQPVLEQLSATDLSARVDIEERTAGTYRLVVLVRVPEDQGLTVESITPEQVEVLLVGTRLPTPTPTPNSEPTPTPGRAPAVSPPVAATPTRSGP